MTVLRHLIATAALLLALGIKAQTVEEPEFAPENEGVTESGADCDRLTSDEPLDPAERDALTAACGQRKSLSNYSQTLAPASGHGKTVEADLVDSDTIKPAIFPFEVVHDRFVSF